MTSNNKKVCIKCGGTSIYYLHQVRNEYLDRPIGKPYLLCPDCHQKLKDLMTEQFNKFIEGDVDDKRRSIDKS